MHLHDFDCNDCLLVSSSDIGVSGPAYRGNGGRKYRMEERSTSKMLWFDPFRWGLEIILELNSIGEAGDAEDGANVLHNDGWMSNWEDDGGGWWWCGGWFGVRMKRRMACSCENGARAANAASNSSPSEAQPAASLNQPQVWAGLPPWGNFLQTSASEQTKELQELQSALKQDFNRKTTQSKLLEHQEGILWIPNSVNVLSCAKFIHKAKKKP